MPHKCLTSWKAAFVVGGVIGTVLLLVGMNLMVGAHVSSSDATKNSSPTQKPPTSTGSSEGKSRYLSVDGPILIGLGALSFVVGSIVGCVKYFRIQKHEKKIARRQSTTQNKDSDCNDNPSEFDGADNNAYSMTPKSQMSLEYSPPPTPLADMVGIMKHPSPEHNNVIITSEIDPVTIINNRSPSHRRVVNGSPSSPMPLLNPLESHFVFHSLSSANQDKSSSASSSPISVRGPYKSSWYMSESPDSHLVRADYNELQCDSSPNMSRRGSPARGSKTSAADLQERDTYVTSVSLNPNLLHPDQAYNHDISKWERPGYATTQLTSAGIHHLPDIMEVSQSQRASPKGGSDKSSVLDTSTSISEEDASALRQPHSDDSGYDSNKRRPKKFDRISDITDLTGSEVPRQSTSKSRNTSSSSSASSEQGSKPKKVTIAVSAGEDTVFEDVVVLSRPQNPVPPRSPRPRTSSAGTRYSSNRQSDRRQRHLSYPGLETLRDPSEEDDQDYSQELPRSNSDDRQFDEPPTMRYNERETVKDRNRRDSTKAAKRTTIAYGQDYDWPDDRTSNPQKRSRHSHQPSSDDMLPGVHTSSLQHWRSKPNLAEFDGDNYSLQSSDMQAGSYNSEPRDYIPDKEEESEGPETLQLRHHGEVFDRPNTWAGDLSQNEDMSLGNKRLSDLPEVDFPQKQNGRKRRKLPDLELVKRRQSRGSSSSATSATPSPGGDLGNDDSDDDNEWI